MATVKCTKGAMLNPTEYNKDDLQSGYRRAKMAWYTIDPFFTNRFFAHPSPYKE